MNILLNFLTFADKYTWRYLLKFLDYIGLNRSYTKNSLMIFSIATFSIAQIAQTQQDITKGHMFLAALNVSVMFAYCIFCYILYPVIYDKFKAIQRNEDGNLSIILDPAESTFLVYCWWVSIFQIPFIVIDILTLNLIDFVASFGAFIFFYSLRSLFNKPSSGKKLKDHIKAGVEKLRELTEAITPKPALIPATVGRKDIS